MHTELDMLDTLTELQALYKQGDLRLIDFEQRIQHCQQQITDHEQAVAELAHD